MTIQNVTVSPQESSAAGTSIYHADLNFGLLIQTKTRQRNFLHFQSPYRPSPSKHEKMQKIEESGQKEKQSEITNRPPIWDCGSSLYDSFEKKAFEKQLDSAISSRTLSMPHLSDRHLQPPPQISNRKTSKLSRSFHKLLRSVFRSKHNKSGEGFYVAYDTSSALSAIPEAPEFEPEIRSLVRRTASDRFPATSIGISCA
ncbi:unnamed protein product [Fraxinus pennsylvanica]|uniref:Uncharacterized protein n=1 Tax=Fraxinus pennsylvanica TaxID=56036 RepID=A0AAD1ZRQ3_9LAMI|nr:unnamed protein product [Fraxinus pennsylvanica]